MSTKSQCLKLIPHLMSARGLSCLEARRNLGITSLHRCLDDLRDMGCKIRWHTVISEGSRYNRYFLASAPPKWIVDQCGGVVVWRHE